MKIELIELGSVGAETKGNPISSPVVESSGGKTLFRTESDDNAA